MPPHNADGLDPAWVTNEASIQAAWRIKPSLRLSRLLRNVFGNASTLKWRLSLEELNKSYDAVICDRHFVVRVMLPYDSFNMSASNVVKFKWLAMFTNIPVPRPCAETRPHRTILGSRGC
jgi:hypothetical protein